MEKTYLWSLRWSCLRNALKQMSHVYGRSSVWVRTWINKLYDLVKWRLQYWQICSLARFFLLNNRRTTSTNPKILILLDKIPFQRIILRRFCISNDWIRSSNKFTTRILIGSKDGMKCRFCCRTLLMSKVSKSCSFVFENSKWIFRIKLNFYRFSLF